MLSRKRLPATGYWLPANPVDSPDRVRIICVREARRSESGRLFHALASKAEAGLPPLGAHGAWGMRMAKSFERRSWVSWPFLAAAMRAGRAKGRGIAVSHWRMKPCEFSARSAVGRRFSRGAAIGGLLVARNIRDLFSNTQSPVGHGTYPQILWHGSGSKHCWTSQSPGDHTSWSGMAGLSSHAQRRFEP